MQLAFETALACASGVVGSCRGATSSASYNLRTALNDRTLSSTGVISAALATKLFCVLAGCAFDTLSQQRGRNKQAFMSNINHYDDLVPGRSEAGEPPNPLRLATD